MKLVFLPVIAFRGRGITADIFAVDKAVSLHFIVVRGSLFGKVGEIGEGTARGDNFDSLVSTVFAGAAVNGVAGSSADGIPGQ